MFGVGTVAAVSALWVRASGFGLTVVFPATRRHPEAEACRRASQSCYRRGWEADNTAAVESPLKKKILNCLNSRGMCFLLYGCSKSLFL